jgi:hypothetical protein
VSIEIKTKVASGFEPASERNENRKKSRNVQKGQRGGGKGGDLPGFTGFVLADR